MKMTTDTQELSTDYRKILGNIGDEVVELAEVAQALYVFSKGFEGAEEEAEAPTAAAPAATPVPAPAPGK